MKKEPLRAVLDEELETLLRSIGQLELLRDGQAVCGVCGKPVDLTNLQMILPLKEEKFQFVCSEPSCVERFSSNSAKEVA